MAAAHGSCLGHDRQRSPPVCLPLVWAMAEHSPHNQPVLGGRTRCRARGAALRVRTHMPPTTRATPAARRHTPDARRMYDGHACARVCVHDGSSYVHDASTKQVHTPFGCCCKSFPPSNLAGVFCCRLTRVTHVSSLCTVFCAWLHAAMAVGCREHTLRVCRACACVPRASIPWSLRAVPVCGASCRHAHSRREHAWA
jgi:hypothetical protein